MSKHLRILFMTIAVLTIAVGVSPLYVPQAAAQQDEVRRAYDTGFQNGVNQARSNRQMNIRTDDWHGDRLTAYQRGVEEGYRSVAGNHENASRYRDPEAQRAFQTGYNNGLRAAQENRAMNMNTDDWHGDRLEAYRHGYEEGYRSGRGRNHDHDRDDQYPR